MLSRDLGVYASSRYQPPRRIDRTKWPDAHDRGPPRLAAVTLLSSPDNYVRAGTPRPPAR